MSEPDAPKRIVVVGGGFAGVHAARRLARAVRGAAEVVIVNPTDYFLYLPLLPEVAGGVLDPRRVAVPLVTACPQARLLLATAEHVDVANRQVGLVDAEGRSRSLRYDHLLLTTGSVNKLLPVPGVAQYAHGFRSIAEALYLRDHLLRQIELADASDDRAEREARCTFVVVGAGYTGTEVAAQGHLLTREVARRHPDLRGVRLRWLLLDLAPRVLPELSPRLSTAAHRTLTARGVEIRTETSVQEATADGVRLSDGDFVPTRSLIWCVGVRPEPLVERLGLPTQAGRLTVDEYLTVAGHPDVYACGDVAAVPDLTRPGHITPMTAQHAVRQAKVAAHNIAAALLGGERRPYRHHDLGFVVDLAGAKATADPLGVPLSGVPAKAVTRGYHLVSLPSNRVRVLNDWVLDAALGRQAVQFGLVPAASVPLDVEAPNT
ncbi:MAG TPA: NAD(P)/FAD-dependent oxidoreductase [Jatrophihabitans sp.]|nr:NAD(P)/FAD-dependent oxidoreductase [Jatrophihabitans sp.]